MANPAATTFDGPLVALREKEIELINDIASALSEGADEDRRRLRDVAQDLRDMFFIVAVIGEFNAGKSSFVNALIGETLLPIGIIPTTEFIELIRYNETPVRVPVVREDGLREWKHPGTGAPGIAIVDTPGTGSVFQRHEQTAKDFLHRSDLVIFLINAKQAYAEADRLYLELAKQYGKKIILVVNQMDLLNAAEQAEVRRFIQTQVRQTLNLDPLIFMVSAKEALAAAERGEDIDKAGNFGPLRAHLRSVYASAPLAKQKLLAQLETTSRIMSRYMDQLKGDQDRVSLDIVKVKDARKELEQQSLNLEAQMKTAGAQIDTILEGVRKRGLEFIDKNLNFRFMRRNLDRDALQREFQDVVIGRSLRDIQDSAGAYVNAVVDQSRLYWRAVIDRLQQLKDLLEQEPSGLDAGVYAEQRASLEDAIRMAETELKTYSQGKILSEMQDLFQDNMNRFQTGALVAGGGVAAMIAAIALNGPIVGAAASPLAPVLLLAGAAVTLVGGVPAYRYYRRVSRETKQAFHERIDLLIKNYHAALDELTQRERNRLTQYGNQMLTPIFTRLEVIAKRANDQEGQMRRYHRDIADLKGRIESLE